MNALNCRKGVRDLLVRSFRNIISESIGGRSRVDSELEIIEEVHVVVVVGFVLRFLIPGILMTLSARSARMFLRILIVGLMGKCRKIRVIMTLIGRVIDVKIRVAYSILSIPVTF